MRDLTKSMFSFSWGMSLFGVQQLVNLFTPSKAAQAFDAVAEAAEKEFGDSMKAAFKAGDNMQKGMVDMTFNIFSPQIFNPSRWMRMASDMIQKSTDALSQGMRGAASGAPGWGPMPGGGAAPDSSPGQAPGSGSGSSPQQASGWGPMPN